MINGEFLRGLKNMIIISKYLGIHLSKDWSMNKAVSLKIKLEDKLLYNHPNKKRTNLKREALKIWKMIGRIKVMEK